MNAPPAGPSDDAMEAGADGFCGMAGAELTQAMAAASGVLARFGPAGDAAVSKVVDSVTSTPEAFSDPQAFFAALERTLQEQLTEHGVAIPPEGFSLGEKGDGQPPWAETGSVTDGAGDEPGDDPSGTTKQASTPTGSSTEVGADDASNPAPGPVAPNQGAGATFAVLGGLPAAESEALAFMVLMLAATSAQDDLAAVMAKVKEINAAKAAQRENLAEAQKRSASQASKKAPPIGGHADKAPKEPHTDGESAPDQAHDSGANPEKKPTPDSPPVAVTAEQALNDKINHVTADLDSISDMGDMESLRLQMAMDRLSKLMSTLSNLLRTVSDTASQITANIK